MIYFALSLLSGGVIFMVTYGIYFGVEFLDSSGKPLTHKPGFWAFWYGLLTHPFKALDNSLWFEEKKYPAERDTLLH